MESSLRMLGRSASPSVGSSRPPPRAVSSVLGNRRGGPVLQAARRRSGPGPSLGELGRQPDPHVRAILQAGLGKELGDVRVHSGPAAQRTLDRSGSDALTSEPHVAIRPEYDHANTVAGRVLLLHELTHMLQQREDPSLRGESAPPRPLEDQARAVAARLGTGDAARS